MDHYRLGMYTLLEHENIVVCTLVHNAISLPKSGKDVSEIFLGMEKAYVHPRLVRKGRICSALGKWKRRI